MQNIVFNSLQLFILKQHLPKNQNLSSNQINQISYEQATNTLLILTQQGILLILLFDPKNDTFELKAKTNKIQEVSFTNSANILLLKFLVDLDLVLCVLENGRIFTIDQKGLVDIKAENQDGIAGASLSPTQEYLYIVTKNSTIVQLDMEFDLVNQVPLDEQEQCIAVDPRFTWRPDGNFFALNVKTKNGRKCLTRDKMMNPFVSPAKSDPNPKDPVQSVAEKGRQNMHSPIAWQPSGGIIAGTDIVENLNRVIFWQKNGLRHLQFDLACNVLQVNNLFWTADSSILFVDCQLNNENGQGRVLFLYYRSNYKWHLKNQIYLESNQQVLSFKTKHNKILLSSYTHGVRLIDFTLQVSRNQWSVKQQQKKHPFSLVYCIDGNIVKISDYAKTLIPPPFSLYSLDVKQNVIGHSINLNQILIITNQKVLLYKYEENKIIKEFQNKVKGIIYGVSLLSESNQKLKFIANNNIFEQKEGKIIRVQKCDQLFAISQRKYKITLDQDEVQIVCEKKDSTLSVNNNILTQDCLSYLFYHEFILYTVSTNHMYDKMYIFNLKLDPWLWKDSSHAKINEKIQQLDQKQKLNIRNVQRGSKILTCSQGRIVFQLPRGNLEAIYPKAIMINQVRKKMQEKLFGKAFEYVRTHRLDINLIVDLNPKGFIENAQQILQSINRVDYLNLLISQINDKISPQIEYALSQEQMEEVEQFFDMHLKGKKVKKICQIISQELRSLNQEKYILSIFTSEIRRGLLNEVLFEIKDLKKNDIQVVVPPHIQKNKQLLEKKNKKLNSQQILEYVCWLVDANFIYEAALLTYDLELAAMTARCTQKDPKQYIPYIQSLKLIQDEVEFKKKICLDLKKFETAIQQLSYGSEQQKKQAIQLVKTHKLYKCGLQTFTKQAQNLKSVKLILIEELLKNNQTNEAYQMSKSIKNYRKCLQIATQNMDTEKIQECLENTEGLTQQMKINKAQQILQTIREQCKNKSDLARLYIYIGKYEEAVVLFLKSGDYKRFYQYINKVSQQFIEKQVIPAFKLQCSLKKNMLLKDKQQYLDKIARLAKVQKHKKNQGGEVHTYKNKQNQDMYSQVSISSKASSYTISTTTGMRRRKDKKRNILTRNVKQGSILEQEYLLAFLQDIRSRAQDNIRDAKLLVQHLIYMNLIEQAEEIRSIISEYIDVMNESKSKSFARIKFEENHHEAVQIYYEERKDNYTFDSFNYLFRQEKN